MFTPTIGLEIHAELLTASKMFCGCANASETKTPNSNICPVCLAHPGTLPVINREAVYKTLQVGVALGGRLAGYSEFDRKNYFYPDIPKGIQISQYAYPLVSGGALRGINITRIHLEEDTARSQHESGGSVVDYNRAGVPLMELVTEPELHSAEDAAQFGRELQILLRFLNASEAHLEKGEMRVEANVSVSDTDTLGTKVEIKNLNSFRSVERAISYEVARQIAALQKGAQIQQETRGWDESKQITFSQRKKETSQDYRYFPEPDLPKLNVGEIREWGPEAIVATLPELPEQFRVRLALRGIKSQDIETFLREPSLRIFYERVSAGMGDSGALLAANYITSDIVGMREKNTLDDIWLQNKDSSVRFAELIAMLEAHEISSRGAKDTLAFLVTETGSVRSIAQREGLLQNSSADALGDMVDEIIRENAAVVAEYRSGKITALQFLIGQAMKKSKGSANPPMLKTIFEEKLR